MKRVSFKTAKALKDAGYPQEYKGYRYTTKKCRGRYVDSPGNNAWYEFDEGELVDGNMYHLFQSSSAYAPTYVEIWLWLWREKKECIDILSAHNHDALVHINGELKGFKDPEEAIEEVIKYAVDNNLIK